MPLTRKSFQTSEALFLLKVPHQACTHHQPPPPTPTPSLHVPPVLSGLLPTLNALLSYLSPVLSTALSQLEKSGPWLLLLCSPLPSYQSRSFLCLDPTLPPHTSVSWGSLCPHPSIPPHPGHESGCETCRSSPIYFSLPSIPSTLMSVDYLKEKNLT